MSNHINRFYWVWEQNNNLKTLILEFELEFFYVSQNGEICIMTRCDEIENK